MAQNLVKTSKIEFLDSTGAVIKTMYLSGGEVSIDGDPIDTGSDALPNTQIWVGNASNVAAAVAMSGQATIANTGAVTLDNASVIGKVLTGFVAGSGTVAATDSILQAIQKLAGTAPYVEIKTYSGTSTSTSATYADITDMTNQTFTIPRAGDYLITCAPVVYNTGAGGTYFDAQLQVLIDDATGVPFPLLVEASSVVTHACCQVVATLTAGAHTVRPQWLRSAGTGTLSTAASLPWTISIS